MTRSLLPEATYDRPVKATLHVHLDNGETFQATAADLAKFGLVDSLDAYMRFDEALGKALRSAGLIGGDITDAALNPVRYLVETAIRNPELLDHPEHNGWRSVAAIERVLQLLPDAEEGLPPTPWEVRDRHDDPRLADDVRDAYGAPVELTEVGTLQAVVRIVNAVTAVDGEG